MSLTQSSVVMETTALKVRCLGQKQDFRGGGSRYRLLKVVQCGVSEQTEVYRNAISSNLRPNHCVINNIPSPQDPPQDVCFNGGTCYLHVSCPHQSGE